MATASYANEHIVRLESPLALFYRSLYRYLI